MNLKKSVLSLLIQPVVLITRFWYRSRIYLLLECFGELPFRSLFLVFLGISLLSEGHALSTGQDIIIAPFEDKSIADILSTEEVFDQCPVYQLDNARQVVLHNGWNGKQDFDYQCRLFWSKNALFIRLDVIDDTVIPMRSVDAAKNSGDSIELSFAHLTCGPDRSTLDPWSISLFPNSREESCAFSFKTTSQETRKKLGKVDTLLFSTLEGYSVIIKLPYASWDDFPRSGGMTRFQIMFDDVDKKGTLDHRFALFPVDKVNGPSSGNVSFGNIRYAKSTWVTVYPQQMVYSQSEATFLMDIGNRTDNKIDIHIYPEKDKKQQSDTSSSSHQIRYSLPQNSIQQKVPIEFSFKGLPSGTYRINAYAESFFDSGAFTVRYNKNNGILYCPDLISRRREYHPRSLNRTPDFIEKTFQHLAGEGKVLWSVGQYDSSSHEFPQYIREIGAHTVNIPEGQINNVPWALFGGLDTLDGMNEPLVLHFSEIIAKNNTEPLIPDFPLVSSRQYPPNAVREKYQYLLLIGVSTEYIDADSYPEIRVFTDEKKVLLHQVLQPATYNGAEQRHAYVLRVWLDSLENINLENPAQYGPKLEIDFLALLGGGDRAKPDGGHIEFIGTPEARMFSKQIATSLFLSKHYLVDADGIPYSSLPGGRYKTFTLRDWGLLIEELASWGAISQAEKLSRKLPLYVGTKKNQFLTLGDAITITGIYHTWRKMGKNRDLLDSIWIPCIHRPITRIIQETETHPLGLFDGSGEFGSNNSDRPAATLPMYFAIKSAFDSAIAMAKAIGYEENAVRWRASSDEVTRSFERHFIVKKDKAKFVSSEEFPESWGIDAQPGITAFLPRNTWIYGRFRDKKPMFYNRDIRVFDTPYLLSGVLFWMDSNGFILDKDMDKQLKASFDYLLDSSPLFRSPSWRQYYMVPYNKSAVQLWTVASTLMLDRLSLATNSLHHYIQYNYDEFVSIPPLADAEVSPYTFEEKITIIPNRENGGAIYDDLNVLTGTTALKIARIITGIDDHDGNQLLLTPRLPEKWLKIKASNWLISHDHTSSATAIIDFTYEKVGENRYLLELDSSEVLQNVTVRMGPFSPKVRKVRITSERKSIDVSTDRHGFFSWATGEYKRVKALKIVAQAIIY